MPPKRKSSYASRGMRAIKRARTSGGFTRKSPIKRSGIRRPAKGFATAVKRVILKTAETKFLTQRFKDIASGSSPPATAGMFHDDIKEFRLLDQTLAAGSSNDTNFGTTLFPSPGDGNANSDGNEIFATGIMLRGTMEIPYDRSNSTTVRMYLVNWNSTQGVPDSNSFYHNVSNNKMLDPIDSDRYPGVKFMGTLRPNNRGMAQFGQPDYVAANPVNQQNTRVLFKRWIPMKKKLFQRFSGSVIDKIDNLKEHMSLIFVPYDKLSTLTTDRVVIGFECTATLYFKDP